jgi:crotonobetainyl-CoA:carnitine CoA-transferase CaiB-like acyl-CoA transferase
MTAPDLASSASGFAGFLGGLRVLEIGNELGEYCGKVLAGLGADVVRVEPPGGETTRGYGPFYRDRPDPNRSLYFWHYNLGKRSLTLDLDSDAGQGELLGLMARADVVIESRPRGYMAARSLGYEAVSSLNPGLVYARISPFGDTGPWADFAGSDLVHLALGGVMMNCGYDADPAGHYDTPPIAPQMWHSNHITGEMTAMSIVAALIYRLTSGRGQYLSTSVHGAVSQSTETDIPDWLFLRQTHHRLTCRHSMPAATGTALSMTKDGRFLLPYRTYTRAGQNVWENTVALLKDFGAEGDLEDPKYTTAYRRTQEASDRMTQLTDRLVMRFKFDRDLWRDAQAHTLAWAPIRRPEENLSDPHWLGRGAFVEVKHPELGETFMYSGAKWRTEGMGWCGTQRPPLVGEDSEEVRRDWTDAPIRHEKRQGTKPAQREEQPRPEPFALSGVRVIDLGWMLASAGAGRFLSAMGAEVIKVEHESHLDGMRFSVAPCPPGGREQRDAATDPIPTPEWDGPNSSGLFMEVNAG